MERWKSERSSGVTGTFSLEGLMSPKIFSEKLFLFLLVPNHKKKFLRTFFCFSPKLQTSLKIFAETFLGGHLPPKIQRIWTDCMPPLKWAGGAQAPSPFQKKSQTDLKIIIRAARKKNLSKNFFCKYLTKNNF